MSKPRRSDPRTVTVVCIAVLAVALFILYTVSIIDFFASPPSEGFGREIRLLSLPDDEPSRPVPDPVVLPSADGRSFFLVMSDGAQTRLLSVDHSGAVLRDEHLDLDLSPYRKISGVRTMDGTVRLLALDGDLNLFVLDPAGDIGELTIDTEVQEFTVCGESVIYLRNGVLRGFITETPERPVDLFSGPVLHYAAGSGDSRIDLAVTTGETDRKYDLLLLRFHPDLTRRTIDRLYSGVTGPLLLKIQDVRVRPDRTDLLSVHRDNKYGENIISVTRVDRSAPGVSKSFQTDVPIMSGPFFLGDGDDHTAEVVLRYTTVYGPNIARITLAESDAAVVEPLTKTRQPSRPVATVLLDGYRALVFSDIADGFQTVYLAGEGPDLMRSGAGIPAAEKGRVAGALVSHLVMTMFFSGVYFLFMSAIPLILTTVLNRNVGRVSWRRVAVTLPGAVVSLAIKISVVRFVIHQTPNYRFPAPLIGGEPYIHCVLVLMSALSFLLSLHWYRDEPEQVHNPVTLMLRCLTFDTVQFGLVFIIYTVTSLMLGRF